MKNVINFLDLLKDNNNKPWFDAHKSEYLAAQAEFTAFAEKLIAGIAGFDPSVAGLTPKDCMYRIYRDTRFSNNKEPYKNWIGAYVCRGGKKSGYAGYYFHVESRGADYIGANVLAAGLYSPESKILKSVREEILDNGQGFETALKKAADAGFAMDQSRKLQRVPRDFPPDSPWAEYLKLKEFSIIKPISEKELYSGNLLEKSLEAFRGCKDINDLFNKAITYAYEEM